VRRITFSPNSNPNYGAASRFGPDIDVALTLTSYECHNGVMQLDGFVQAVREDLARIAAVGDESTARAADLVAIALEPSLGRRLQEALAEAALELSAQLERGSVEVRIRGAEPELVYVSDTLSAPAEAADGAFDARITLRLPEGLKSRVEVAAAANAVSVNTWLVQALNRALASPTSGGGTRRRLIGYGRS
jgi:predicted HicB family RNase H-like nuclease